MKTRILSLLFLIAFIAVASPGQAAEKWALLVGINNYQNDISTLKFCISDVEAFRQALVDFAGFKPKKIFLMTDQMSGQSQPTHVNVIMRLDILARQIQPDDTFVFYFSGHGIARDDQSFLLAANSVTTTANTLELTAIPLQKVSQILSQIKAQQLLTIIDACRNNPSTGRGDQDNLLSDEFTRGIKIKRGSGRSGRPRVSATLYACNIGERAYEWVEKGHGVFSYYLLEGMKGQAVNAKGEVTITGLAEYTQEKVVNWAEEFRGKKQTPWLSLQGGAKLVIADKLGAVSKPGTTSATISSIDAEAEMWGMVKDSGEVGDINDFLQAFPDGKLAAVARLKLKQLERRSKPTQPVSKPKVDQRDDAKMVLVPAGSFQMGSNDGEDNEKPVHKVYVDAFYMDEYEVTNAQYRKFVQATGHREPGYWDDSKYNQPSQPVVGVSWHDAVAYARWSGKRLPTEAEWEYAARGGLEGKKYPWGDTIGSNRACFDSDKANSVGSYSASGYGLYDMAGNVWEWCSDWYGSDYYSKSPSRNPQGPSSGSTRVLRGGSWNIYSDDLRAASRVDFYPSNSSNDFGFRCVSGFSAAQQ